MARSSTPPPASPADDPAADAATDPISQPLAMTPVGHSGARVNVVERPAWFVDGFLALFVGVALVAFTIWRIIALATAQVTNPSAGQVIGTLVPLLLSTVVFSAVSIVQPGQTKVVSFSAATSAPRGDRVCSCSCR